MTYFWPPAWQAKSLSATQKCLSGKACCCIYSNINLPSGVEGENAVEQDSHLGFFHYHQGQLGTAQERDLESNSSARTQFPCRAAMAVQAPQAVRCPDPVHTWLEPMWSTSGLDWAWRSSDLGCAVLLAHPARPNPQLGLAPAPAPSRLPGCHAGFPRPVCQRGALPQWNLLPLPRGAAQPRRSAEEHGALLPAAAVARGGARGAALRLGQRCLALALVWYAAQTSYTSTAVLPAPTPSWPGHWEASRQSGVGMGPGQLLQLLLGCWPSRKAMWYLDSHGLGPAIADTC